MSWPLPNDVAVAAASSAGLGAGAASMSIGLVIGGGMGGSSAAESCALTRPAVNNKSTADRTNASLLAPSPRMVNPEC